MKRITLSQLWNREAAAINKVSDELKRELICCKQSRVYSDDTKELIQEAMLRFFSKKKAPQLEKDAVPYFMGMIKHIRIDRLRKRKIALTREEELERLHICSQILDQTEMDEATRVIHQMFKQLTEKCQVIIHLSTNTELSAEEIAERLGYESGSVVHSTKYKCMQRLRKSWKWRPEVVR